MRGKCKAYAYILLPRDSEIVAVHAVGIVQLFLEHPLLYRIGSVDIWEEVEYYWNRVGVGSFLHRVGKVFCFVCLHITSDMVCRSRHKVVKSEAIPDQRATFPVPLLERIMVRVVVNKRVIAEIRLRVSV